MEEDRMIASGPPTKDCLAIEIVVPVYNEGEGIERFHAQLSQALEKLPHDFTIRYVDDGSTDQTGETLAGMAARDGRALIIELSRNFGHQAALTSGPFYRALNRIADTQLVLGAADFRLLSRRVTEGLRTLREHHRFLRGMIAWMGYRTAILPYTPRERLVGHSKYSLRKMVRLAMDATFSFSLVPLYLGVLLGLLFIGLAAAEAIYVGSLWLGGHRDVLAPGGSSLMFMLLIVGGALSTLLGVVGIYVGYIFQEVKRRPSYFIRREIEGSGKGPG